MKGLIGFALGWVMWTAFVWAVGAFVCWNRDWYLVMAEWDLIVRFFILLPFGIIGFYVSVITAALMES